MFLEKVFFEELKSPRLFLKPFYWLHENIEKKALSTRSVNKKKRDSRGGPKKSSEAGSGGVMMWPKPLSFSLCSYKIAPFTISQFFSLTERLE